LRLALLIDRWQPRRGGAEVALEALAQHMLRAGDEVLAFACEGPRAGESTAAEFVQVGFRRVTGLFGRGAMERARGRALMGAAERAGAHVTLGVRHLDKVDVLWLHGGCHADTQEALYRARNGGELPPGGLELSGRHRTFVDFERAALEGGARCVICPSELVRQQVLARYPSAEPRLVVAPSGVDLERFHPRERDAATQRLRQRVGAAAHEKLVVLAARNPELKGFPDMLAALAPLQHLPWRLVLAGVKRRSRWQRLAANKGLATRVSVVGDMDSVELAAGADLCVLPTWRDTSGLVLLEALACGTPVLTTRFAGAADLLVGSGAGQVLAAPNARAEWTRALAEELGKEGDTAEREATRRTVLERGAEVWLEEVARVCRGLNGATE
jgi:glycosyltransferase involved in cell wall biosynthesis